MNKLAMISFGMSALMIAGCSQARHIAPSALPAVRVSLVQSKAAQVPQIISLTGTVHAKETAMISAQATGRIRAVLVQAGQPVRMGQLLITLDDAAEKAALARATAAELAVDQQQQIAAAHAALAASTLRRYRLLQKENSVSPQEFDEVQKKAQAAELQVRALQAQSAEARAAVDEARTALGYTELRAPFPGVVTARMADPGTLATPGMPLLQIDQGGPLQVYATVDESLLGAVHTGMRLPVGVDASGAADLTGTVAEVVPAADPSSHSFLLKLNLPANPALHPGMYATVGLTSGKQSVVLAPKSAIVQRGSLSYVYVLDSQGTAQLRYVTLGQPHDNDVIVLSGLAAGEKLVDQPGDRDLAGKRIEALP